MRTVMPANKIAVTFSEPLLQAKAAALAYQLQLPLVEADHSPYDFLLVYTPQHLEICPIKAFSTGSLHIDFLTGKAGYRRSHTFIKNELLAKAVGVKGNSTLSVIDATAGLGRDSFILACLGCSVTLLERSPVMAALLEDGLQRLNAVQEYSAELVLSLIHTNASQYLARLDPLSYPDVIYLDPMYPHRTKSALVKKEMRIIREIVGEDQDAEQLLAIARTRAKKRIVVKRPRLAPALGQQVADFSYSGKQHRFDVYLPSVSALLTHHSCFNPVNI